MLVPDPNKRVTFQELFDYCDKKIINENMRQSLQMSPTHAQVGSQNLPEKNLIMKFF